MTNGAVSFMATAMSSEESADHDRRVRNLSGFLQRTPGVQAILLNDHDQTLSVATLGRVDEAELKERLATVMREADSEFSTTPQRVSVSNQSEGEFLLEKETCPTAPSFWRWRPMPWFGEREEEDANEWKLLLGSVAAFALGRAEVAPAAVVTTLYLLAIVAGGWDAAIDAWHGFRRGHLDVHFLMLAVAIGASLIGAYGEGALLLFLFSLSGALDRRAPSQRFTDRFGTPYTWFVLGLTTAYFLFSWLVLGVAPFVADEGFSAFYRAMTLLVVASPCALVLSIPSAILAAIARGAKHGIRFRGGAAVEKLAAVDLVAMDKTGTLTRGEMEVLAIESLPAGREQETAELAYALESHSSHPIARAIVRYGTEQKLDLHPARAFQSIMGKGVRAETDHGPAMLGRREILTDGGMDDLLKDLPPPPPTCTEVWILRGDPWDLPRAMDRKIMQVLRVTSLTEGVSYLLLLLVAMPMKYGFGIDAAVTWVGWAHGVLFVLLGLVALAAMIRSALPFKLACIVGIAALLPGGPFFIDGRLRRHQESLPAG